jgi:glyoxylase-like metal-dependent hydrolase (beta-lactamase superfamily II)
MKVTDVAFALDCTKGAYAYAALGADGVTLIDTGNPGKGAAILSELDGHGIKPNEIKRILLTHHDTDHIGSAAYLQQQTGCEIFIHSEDYAYVMDGKRREGIKGVLSIFMKNKKPSEVKQFSEDGAIGEFTAIYTPGHTRGHTVYRFQDVLFLGDLVNVPTLFIWDKKLANDSIRSLPVDGVVWLCMAHGEPIRAAEWSKYEK